MTTASAGMPQRRPVERMPLRRRHVPERKHAAVHHEHPLDLELLVLGHVRERVGELEVHGGEADGARARDVRDLHARGLARENPRPRAARVRRQVDEDVEVVLGDPLRGLRVVERGDHVEALAGGGEALGPVVALARRRIEVELEAIAVVMRDHLPHHLAHHVIAQVRGQVADAQRPGLARRGSRHRRPVDPPRDRVVRLRVAQHQRRLDVEEQQQVQKLLEAIEQFRVVARLEVVATQSVEVALEVREVRHVLARLERIDGQRQRVGAALLERAEVREPGVDLPGGQQDLADVLVGRRRAPVRRRAPCGTRRAPPACCPAAGTARPG